MCLGIFIEGACCCCKACCNDVCKLIKKSCGVTMG